MTIIWSYSNFIFQYVRFDKSIGKTNFVAGKCRYSAISCTEHPILNSYTTIFIQNRLVLFVSEV